MFGEKWCREIDSCARIFDRCSLCALSVQRSTISLWQRGLDFRCSVAETDILSVLETLRHGTRESILLCLMMLSVQNDIIPLWQPGPDFQAQYRTNGTFLSVLETLKHGARQSTLMCIKSKKSSALDDIVPLWNAQLSLCSVKERHVTLGLRNVVKSRMVYPDCVSTGRDHPSVEA